MKKIFSFLFFITLAFLSSLHCQGKIPSYKLVDAFPHLPDFNRPVDLQNARDGSGRIFVVEQEGKIWSFVGKDTTRSRKLFLDITSRVNDSGNEEGLLGLAFHPNFKQNKFFYVDYTADNPSRTVISRFQISKKDLTIADGASEFVVLEIPQPYSNHNGGQIVFGADGYLYIGMGDGGSGGDPYGNGQNLQSLHGKILRINVDSTTPPLHYSIPKDNPFVNSVTARKEIWCYGIRNAWRMSFDPVTNFLYCGDVGQNAIEEIDIIEKGKNYGWNIMEGNSCYEPSSDCNQTGLTKPIKEYSHDFGASITGGFVYRGPTVPSLTGKYIYSDYVSGRIWQLVYDGKKISDDKQIVMSGVNISSFGVDEQNELYMCTFQGRIYKFASEITPIDYHK